MKIMLGISLVFILLDIFLFDSHLFHNLSGLFYQYSFFKWIFISIFSFVAALIVSRLNLNYFAELARKDNSEMDNIDSQAELDNPEINETQQAEITEEKESDNPLTQDIGSKTLPKT